MEGRQGWYKGLNQDSSSSKRDPQSYYYANNFRVVTEGGLSTGSLETESGHVIAFKVPDIPEQTLTNGDIIPAQTGLRIIGSTTMVDRIIIFTTNSTSVNPTSYGQVWELTYDESTDSVSNLSGGLLTVADHLKYNNAVNFSTEYRIKAVCRYENNLTRRVYWTDNYNPVRVLNIADPLVADISVENLDLQSSVDFIQPTITGILNNGNLQTACKVQIGYRLISNSGAETLYSPVSSLVNLIEDSYQDSNLQDIDGDGSNLIKNKAITYSLTGLDTDYDIIEHIAIVYSPLNIFTIYKFDEDSIPDTGNLSVVLSDLDEATVIDPTEFNMLSSGFSVAKDLEVKGNRLIAANLRNTNFEVDFDSRAYRFNSSQDARIYDSTGALELLIDGAAPVYPNNTTEAEFDAINKYNDESDVAWSTNQYKFRADGITLGGDGPNVSYEFVTRALVANNLTSHPTLAGPHVDTNNFAIGTPAVTHNVLEADGNTKDIQYDGQHPNFASQWATSEFVGYTRGEIYRFGIVFYNNKGSVSFVNWIGDIRFPDVSDGFPLMQDVAGVPTMYSLGINFTVDISSIASQISGYSIVRLERGERDSTKLGSGLLMVMDRADDGNAYSILHRWEDTGEAEALNNGNPYEVSAETELFGSNILTNLHLNDMPGHPFHTIAFPSALRVCYLLSPIGQLYNVDFRNGDYIDVRGYYSSTCALYGGNNFLYGVTAPYPDDESSYMFYYKMEDWGGYPTFPERFEIGATRVMSTAGFISNTSSLLTPYTGGNNVLNTSYCRASAANPAKKYHPLGMGSPKLLTLLSATPTIPNNTGDPSTNMTYPYIYYTGADALSFDASGVSTNNPWFKEVMYSRYLNNQYGGDNFESRSVNQYISTGHFQYTRNLPAANNLTFEVFGGDTYVTYYDDETIQWNLGGVDPGGIYKEPTENELSIATVFPVEVPINSYMRTARHWARDRSGSNPKEYESNSYTLPTIYSQENNAVEKFFAKDFALNLTEEYPHRLWASEVKIDGEFIDSWRSFKIANIRDVDGIYGPINALKTFKDNLLFYQDRAFGMASLDERSIIQDDSGQQLILGTGGVFPDYGYVSTNTGTVHQYSVVDTDSAVYHFDARLKKLFQYTGQANGISDVLGLSSFLDSNLSGSILNTDRTLSEINGGNIGVHAIQDLRYNRVLFTFLNTRRINMVIDEDVPFSITIGTVFSLYNRNYIANELLEFDAVDTLSDYIFDNPESATLLDTNYTFSYNEMLNAFESFYDYRPNQYLQYGRRLLSVNPYSTDEMYVHNIGSIATYYGQAPSTSIIHTVLAADGVIPKIWNNLNYNAELYDTNNVDVYNETFNRFRMYSEYQDTGTIDLINNSNIKRRMRTWHYTIPRDNEGNLARLRNPWIHLVLEYDNNANKRMVLHDVMYNFTPSKY